MRYNINTIGRQEMSKKSNKFVEIASPNKQGFSNNINIEDLPLELKGNNGKAWSRETDLGSRFYMIKTYKRGKIDTREEKQKSGGRYGKLISIQLVGKK